MILTGYAAWIEKKMVDWLILIFVETLDGEYSLVIKPMANIHYETSDHCFHNHKGERKHIAG